MDEAPADLQPFPVSRFVYYGDCRCYYAYSTTPPEDFLENVTEIEMPAILLLGCGDIRSCLYTLWKNFDPLHKRPPFSGIHFVLNDYNAAVLARNILFLYLCLQMPSKKEDMKKWIATLWSLWYCHELLPEHELVLKDAVTNLLRWSCNLQSWSAMTTSPLSKIVNFASASTLQQIRYYWEAWYNRKTDPGSVQALRAMRKMEFLHKLGGRTDSASIQIANASLGLLGKEFSLQMLEAMKIEIQSYIDSGNAFAESVLDSPAAIEGTVINPTFFDRAGRYTLHYLSEPYNCFFQTVVFSPKEMKKMGTPRSLLNQLIVDDNKFENQLTLSNSVQQFAIWLSSAAATLANASSHQNPHVSFTFQCCDALDFCQFLQHNTHAFATSTGFDPMFDLVHSSNLIDHLSPPNLVLSVVPLLKENGLLLTTAMLYKNIAHTAEGYLQVSFGFESKLLPLICGIRCVGHEGKYASSVCPQPVPCSFGAAGLAMLSSKLLVWQRVSTPPLRLASLESGSAAAILRALSASISVAMDSFFVTSVGLRTTGHLSTGTVIQLLQCFVAQLASDVGFADYHFWEPLCATLRDREDIKPFMLSLQTQALLHGVHLHLTVSRHNCPLCAKSPLCDAICQFSMSLDVPHALADSVGTPSFVLFLHRASYTDLHQILLSRGNDIHVIDCLAGSETDGKLKLNFFVPQSFAEEGYQLTAGCFVMTHVDMQPVNVPTMVMHGNLSDFWAPDFTYCFKQLQSRLAAPESRFGKIIQHSGDGDRFESVVSLSDSTMSALEKHNIDLQRVSNSEIKVSCGNHSIRISYPHPIHYNNTSIKLSRKKKMVTVEVPRKAHQYFDEMPLFVANPDSRLSLPPVSISHELTRSFCGMQFTKKDRDIMNEYNRESALMPAEVNMKETLNALFQFHSSNYVHLSFASSGVHGLLAIHNRLFDQQNKTPAIDLSFCFLEMSFLHQVAPPWQSMIPDKVRNINVTEEEYELLKKVFHHFARRTVTTSKKPYGRFPQLVKNKINRFFTRAVVYPLYTDPDVLAEAMGIIKGVNELVQPYMSTAVTNPQYRMQAVKEYESKRKCSFCGTRSDDLKKCGRCGEAQYCGQDCQKAHWKEHKQACTSQSAALPDVSVPDAQVPTVSVTRSQEKVDAKRKSRKKRKCSFCGQYDALKKCGRCGKAQYCGQSCQKKHWKEHKLICNPQDEMNPQIDEADPQIDEADPQIDEADPQIDEVNPRIDEVNPQDEAVPQDEPNRSVKAENLHSVSNMDLGKCEGCEKEFSSLRRCRCHRVAYCSVECQRKDWPKHKDVCTAKKQVSV